MSRTALLLFSLLAPLSHAETGPRCATDAFGNTVCMDKDGVISVKSGSARDEDVKANSGVAKSGSMDNAQPRRCAVDDFGNKVCSQD
ncbi:MAG: hypothetical protein KJ795_03570 [Gammaproteobacteria bacterium]|nr:hypothetical protein [Gammaproteobacteria bacterium]MBU1777680.1 hypothetical protein [Gammaproteobacteria bacterium]MBU1967850.1 hypothetical protein [Gammaproteobacteria bacterium]